MTCAGSIEKSFMLALLHKVSARKVVCDHEPTEFRRCIINGKRTALLEQTAGWLYKATAQLLLHRLPSQTPAQDHKYEATPSSISPNIMYALLFACALASTAFGQGRLGHFDIFRSQAACTGGDPAPDEVQDISFPPPGQCSTVCIKSGCGLEHNAD